MDQPPVMPPSYVWITFWFGAWLCFLAWVAAFKRLHRGKPLIDLQPRRQVPWGGFDLLLVFVFFVISSVAMLSTVGFLLGPGADRPVPGVGAETSHAILQLMRDGSLSTVLLCAFSAVLVAPFVEEFLFRVLLQGWLERLDRNLRPMAPVYRRLLRWGTGPVLLSSFLFALVHFRGEGKPMNPQYLFYMITGNSLVGIATAVFAALVLRFRVGATAADMGFVVEKIPGDIALGLGWAAGVILPIFLLQAAMITLLPPWLAADPFSLLWFALALGTLYCRTHRATAGIVLHMSLNTVTVTMIWLSSL